MSKQPAEVLLSLASAKWQGNGHEFCQGHTERPVFIRVVEMRSQYFGFITKQACGQIILPSTKLGNDATFFVGWKT